MESSRRSKSAFLAAMMIWLLRCCASAHDDERLRSCALRAAAVRMAVVVR
jgi:hypothetical protein